MGFWFSPIFDLSEKGKKAWQDIPEKQFWVKISLLLGVVGLLLLVTFFLGASISALSFGLIGALKFQ